MVLVRSIVGWGKSAHSNKSDHLELLN